MPEQIEQRRHEVPRALVGVDQEQQDGRREQHRDQVARRPSASHLSCWRSRARARRKRTIAPATARQMLPSRTTGPNAGDRVEDRAGAVDPERVRDRLDRPQRAGVEGERHRPDDGGRDGADAGARASARDRKWPVGNSRTSSTTSTAAGSPVHAGQPRGGRDARRLGRVARVGVERLRGREEEPDRAEEPADRVARPARGDQSADHRVGQEGEEEEDLDALRARRPGRPRSRRTPTIERHRQHRRDPGEAPRPLPASCRDSLPAAASGARCSPPAPRGSCRRRRRSPAARRARRVSSVHVKRVPGPAGSSSHVPRNGTGPSSLSITERRLGRCSVQHPGRLHDRGRGSGGAR